MTVPAIDGQLRAEENWPLLAVMGALLCSRLSHFLRKKGMASFADPLEHTGLLLPLVPLTAFWQMPSAAFPLGRYALVWLVAGFHYELIAIASRSVRMGTAAAAAVIAGWWTLLAHHQVVLGNHPQLWLIPPALTGLAFIFFGRARLDRVTVVRMASVAVVVIYGAGVAELFVAGLGSSVLLPLEVIAWSLAGFFVGRRLSLKPIQWMGGASLLLVVVSLALAAGAAGERPWVFWGVGAAEIVALLAFSGGFDRQSRAIDAPARQTPPRRRSRLTPEWPVRRSSDKAS
jgi:hypothetical protein